MKSRNLILVMAAAAVLAGQTPDADVALQRAIRKERVEGDLSGAIELYKKVIAGAAKNRAAAAKALLGLGECYEKQGNAEAQRAYERLVREFSDQAAPAREAQSRLAAMRPRSGGKSVMAQLIARGAEVDLEGRVTADGRLYVFVDQDNGNLAVRDLKTGSVRHLTKEGTGTENGGAHGHTPIPSRDGKQVAYAWYLPSFASSTALRMELRVINIDGSGVRTVPLDIRAGYSRQVLDWFPDGRRILVSAVIPGATREELWRGLAAVELGTGAEHRIAKADLGEGSRSLSPDGRWLLLSRPLVGHDADWDILAFDTQTGQQTTVVKGTTSDRNPMWVPDSDRFVFRSDRNGKEGIWMSRFKDGEAVGEATLVKPDAGDFTPFGVSRDGSLYYGVSHQSTDVYQANVDPQTLRLQGAPTRLETYIGHNSTPAWSPSGDSFAYYSARELNKGFRLVVHHPDGKEVTWSTPITHLNPPSWCGGGDRLLARCTPNCPTRRFVDPGTGETLGTDLRIARLDTPYQLDYSPDCNSVYVSAYLAATQRRRIYLADVQTGKQTEVTADGGEWALSPRVSPDGRWLALYGVVEGGKKAGLLVVSTAGGAIRMLDPDGDIGSAWTPDSKRLMYTREVKRATGQGTEKELYWVPVEGGTPQPMGIRMPGALAPSLNPDGKRLLFSAGESYRELWVLRNLSLN